MTPPNLPPHPKSPRTAPKHGGKNERGGCVSRQRNSKVFWDKIPLYCAVPALSSRRGHRWHLGVASCPLGGPGSHWATPGDPQGSPGGRVRLERRKIRSWEGLELSFYPWNCPVIPGRAGIVRLSQELPHYPKDSLSPGNAGPWGGSGWPKVVSVWSEPGGVSGSFLSLWKRGGNSMERPRGGIGGEIEARGWSGVETRL